MEKRLYNLTRKLKILQLMLNNAKHANVNTYSLEKHIYEVERAIEKSKIVVDRKRELKRMKLLERYNKLGEKNLLIYCE